MFIFVNGSFHPNTAFILPGFISAINYVESDLAKIKFKSYNVQKDYNGLVGFLCNQLGKWLIIFHCITHTLWHNKAMLEGREPQEVPNRTGHVQRVNAIFYILSLVT